MGSGLARRNLLGWGEDGGFKLLGVLIRSQCTYCVNQGRDKVCELSVARVDGIEGQGRSVDRGRQGTSVTGFSKGHMWTLMFPQMLGVHRSVQNDCDRGVSAQGHRRCC